jgi:predicted alpha-1,2-mannosidase
VRGTVSTRGSRRVGVRRFVTVAAVGLAIVPVVVGAAATGAAAAADPSTLVDEFVGTQDNVAANTTESAYGDTSPGATTPFGMVNLNPTTYNTAGGGNANQGGYEYDADEIRSFSLNRVSGTGCVTHNGAEDFPVLPYAGALPGGALPSSPAAGVTPYYEPFSHSHETATPGYYAVTTDNGISSELTATTRTGDGRFTFPAGAQSGTLVFDVAGSLNGSENSSVELLGDDVVEGSTTVQATCDQGVQDSYTAYFYARFATPFRTAGTWQGSAITPIPQPDASTDAVASSTAVNGTGAYVSFAPGSSVVVNIGLSYVSTANARANMQAETEGHGFDQLRSAAHSAWSGALGQVRVTGAQPARLTTFYTALYHTMLHPNVLDDVDGQYTGYDKQVHTVRPGHHEYATYSGWDIYRDEAQLVALLFPDRASDMAQSITDLATQVGLYNWPMLDVGQNKLNGDSLDSVLASLDAFGATDYDRATALHTLVAAQTLQPNGTPGTTNGVPDLDHRQAAYQYTGLGFLTSGSSGAATPTSASLEYAVDDFGIAQLAGRLGDTADQATFMGRAQSWQNLFDPAENGLDARAKTGFDHTDSLADDNDGQFAEGSGDQYGWMVPQNVGALVAKKGGADQVEAQLDTFFGNFAPGSTNVNPGHNSPYAYMSNEIDSEAPELYNWIGRPDRTEQVNQEIRDALWTNNSPDGLFGNDDLGALSAWYVWSSIGVFPAIYGRSELVVSGPTFTSVRITSSGAAHRTYTFDAPARSTSRQYVTGMRVDGRATGNSWLPESFAQRGGTVDFTLSAKPGTWGTAKGEVPPSFGDGSGGYDNIGVTPPGDGGLGSFDASNNTFPSVAPTPAPGATVSFPGSAVTYTWPKAAPGTPDNWIPSGQVVDLGGARLSQISFLGAATNGPATGYASVNYTDGTHQVVDVALDDWTTPKLPAGTDTALITVAHRNSNTGAQDNTTAMLWGTRPQPLDGWKKVASVTLPKVTDAGIMHVFAVGSAPATAAPLTVTAASVPAGGSVLPAGGSVLSADLADFHGGAGAAPGDYTAQVSWGDGSGAHATVLALDDLGGYTAFGTHSYARPGRYRVSVAVSDGTTRRTVVDTVVVSRS